MTFCCRAANANILQTRGILCLHLAHVQTYCMLQSFEHKRDPAIAEMHRDALCQVKFCEVLYNRTKIALQKACLRWVTSKVIKVIGNGTTARGTYIIFTARRSYASRVLGVVILSVCLSVCHTRAL